MEESIEEVDWYGNVLGNGSREGFDNSKVHKVVVIFLRNKKGKVILGRRAKDKEPYPDKWFCTAGGWVRAQEKNIDAAYRELKEETGIVCALEEVCSVKYDGEDYKAIFYVYTSDDKFEIEDLKLDKSEVQYFEQFSVNRITKMLTENEDEFALVFRPVFDTFIRCLN